MPSRPYRFPAASGWHAAAAVALLALCTALPALAQADGRGGHVTRAGAAFAELEESLLRAVRERRAADLERLLDDDFAMTLAQDPTAPVAREDWLEAVRKPGSGDWVAEQLAVREFGGVAVASLVLRPQPARSGAAPLFVVDTWRLDGTLWRLATRQVAPASGARRGIPGDVPASGPRKKI
jgi:hypothetical protein